MFGNESRLKMNEENGDSVPWNAVGQKLLILGDFATTCKCGYLQQLKTCGETKFEPNLKQIWWEYCQIIDTHQV